MRAFLVRGVADAAGPGAWRCARGFVFLAVLIGWSALRAQTTNAAPEDAPSPPSRPWATTPSIPTNSAASVFLENHLQPDPSPTPTPPPPAPEANLSLRSGAPSTNEAPQALAPNSGEPRPFHFSNPAGQPDALPDHLLVVYNTNDGASRELARYYADRRGIASDHVLGIACPVKEEITRDEYESTIRESIMSYLCQKTWMTRRSEQVRVDNRMLELLIATHNDIWAIALMRGVPLKIAPDPSEEDGMQREPQLRNNAAAVDSELALLPIFGLPKGGYAPNPFFDGDVTGQVRAGPELATKIILVTRLDGPTPADVRRMIDDSILAESNRLAGEAVIDTRGRTDVRDGYTSGDIWLRQSRALLEKDGWTVRFDDKEAIIPATDPLNHVAFYLGWYSNDAAGPWVTLPNRFVPGAIAYHLHSYSANTVRNPNRNWVGPLIAHGAAATMGTVYEPYLILTPRLDIFTKRLLDGQTFAEAAYASERGLSWMVTVVGDPLYRPFQKPLEVALASTAHSEQYDWLLLQQVQRQMVNGEIGTTPEALKAALMVPGIGAVVEERLGDLLEKSTDPAAVASAEEAYKKAMALDGVPVDRIRVGLKLAQLYSNRSQDELAQAQLKQLSELYPVDAPRFGVVSELVPTASSTTNGASATPPETK